MHFVKFAFHAKIRCFAIKWYMYSFSVLDIILMPVYIIIMFAIARKIILDHANEPAYEYFLNGLYVKIIGSLALCFIYLFYYQGGDTVNYMGDTRVLMRLANRDLGSFFDIVFNGIDKEKYSVFNNEIGFPQYYHNKTEEWRVIRYTVPFSIMGLGYYIPTSLIVAFLSYLGNFRLYVVFAKEFPHIYKKLALPLLFIPSAAFWGSGILKDTYTFSAIGWFTYGFYMAFIKRENIRSNIVAILLASYIIVGIKPYIFIALLPGSLIWLNFTRLRNIKSTFLRALALPVFVVVLGVGGLVVFNLLGSSLGDKYSSVDKALQTAVVTQQDLKRAEYQGASFDIGNFDPTLSGIASKIPAAITAGLFRPFIWESRNAVMLLSGLENLFFMLFTVRLFFTLGLFGFFKKVGNSPLLIFSLIFSLFFAFSVGLTTSNFGSLVRYKIPCEPFYLGMLFTLYFLKKESLVGEEKKELTIEEREDEFKRLRSKTGFIVK
jgi:hypothetical protein